MKIVEIRDKKIDNDMLYNDGYIAYHSPYKWNLLKDNGKLLFKKHLYKCYNKRENVFLIQFKPDEYNYVNSEGKILLDENVHYCEHFSNYGLGKIQYKDFTFNFVNYNGKLFFKSNIKICDIINSKFIQVLINNNFYRVDNECNFYNVDNISFKELYNSYPQKRQELIEIIEKYTYHDINEYFNI